MKKLRTTIKAADDGGNSKLLEAIDALKEDFDYIISGLEKLDRTGASESNEGLIIAENIQDNLQDAISQIASKIA